MLYSKSLMSRRTPNTRSYSPRGKVLLIQCGDRRRHTDRYGAGRSWPVVIPRFVCVHYWTKQKIEVHRTPRPRGQSRCAAPEPVLALRRNTTGPDADIIAGSTPTTTFKKFRNDITEFVLEASRVWTTLVAREQVHGTCFQGSFERPLSFLSQRPFLDR